MPYINGIKHLGNLIGSMLPADVYARFLRQRGEEVLYICATDEHGTPAELAAAEAGMDVATYCKEQHDLQAESLKQIMARLFTRELFWEIPLDNLAIIWDTGTQQELRSQFHFPQQTTKAVRRA